MTGTDAFSTFTITDPLPRGTTLLEASAGTGKTWTIGALVTRYVAEGVVTLPELLVITFGRAASQEMRERVRAQLVEAEAALATPAGFGGDSHPLLDLLTDADEPELDRRRRRLRAAIAEFDAATIATTHQFCQTVLRSLGTAGDSDPNADLVENVDDLVHQIVDDLYLAKYAREAHPALSHGDARELARTVVGDPHAALTPVDADPDSTAALRVRFAAAVRGRLDRRKRELGVLDYDDLLRQLETALESAGSPARAFMRSRWKVVLVDEFQDTDPVQWNILERAFGQVATLVLIGDPKQAIYAFRGGDVFTYLTAARTATDRRTLTTNWRTDAPLVDALGATFAGAELGHPDIAVRPITAHHGHGRLVDAPQPAPFRLRVLTRADFGDAGKEPAIGAVRARIAEDLADDVAELLASGARLETDDGRRAVAAGDIAVLVATGGEANLVHATFARRGIPAVIGGGSNVLRSDAADQWLTLLEAMESPAWVGLVRAAALTDFFGHDAADLGTHGDTLTDEVSTRIRGLADLADSGGIAAVIEAVSDDAFAARVMSRPDGSRQMTDLRHVAQLLHSAALHDRLALPGLVQWLRRRRSEAGESEELTRRLDSDAKAVQVLTVHTSKGLEFPVVHLPFLFNRWVRDEPLPRFHDGAGGRFLDVGGTGHPGHRDAAARARAEDAGEAMRLAYVAMTRAKSQLVAWWAPTRDAANGGLHRLLFRPDPRSPQIPNQAAVPDDDTALEVLTGWQDRGGPAVERVTARLSAPAAAGPAETDLGVRHFDRHLDTAWRRTSYSGLTRVLEHQPHVGSEAITRGTTDEDDETDGGTLPAGGAAGGADDPEQPSPMAGLPTGAAFGSLVHGVLEHVDVTAADLHAELVARVESELSAWPVDADPAATATALEAVLRTPLGPLADDLDLATVLRDRQLTELDFEIPLAGGDRPAALSGHVGELADLLDAHLDPDDPMRPFASRLRSPALAGQSLRGYLSGSIDLLLRLPSGRVLVVDYKTNWLGPFDAPLTLTGYRPTALADAMNSGTYPLQALLYSAVAHRFCRWRMPDYDPERHLGGILYLYVRGMAGPDTPREAGVPAGVFAWRPPAALIVALSDLLDAGGAP